MLELTLLGTAMRAVYWIVHFIMMAPDPAVLPPAPTQTPYEIAFPAVLSPAPTQTPYEIAFPSSPNESMEYEN